MLILLRSCLFAIVLILITPPCAIIALLTFPLPALTRYRIISIWSRLVLLASRHICGIRYRVVGAHNIPSQPVVVLSKHQSAWETIAFQVLFPPQAYVIKRELLWIPFFGWGLALFSPIAIDRKAGARAMKQMLELGKDRLTQGFWVVVYPEGTRVAPGKRGRYRRGGAAIACHAQVPILPVAHNAGLFWRRNAFLKYPGTITVSIGAAIDSRSDGPEALTARVEHWIESEMARLETQTTHDESRAA